MPRLSCVPAAILAVGVLTASAADAGERPYLSPRFWLSDDPNRELQRWLSFARRNRKYLEKAVKLAPATPEARRARAVLKEL